MTVMDEKIKCVRIFTYKHAKSFPIFCGINCCVKVIAGFNPFPVFISFVVDFGGSLELLRKAERFSTFGTLIVFVKLSGSYNEW